MNIKIAFISLLLVTLGAGLTWKGQLEELGATLAVAGILVQAIVWDAPRPDTRRPLQGRK